MFFDWHRFHADEMQTPEIVDSRRRIPICLIGFVLLLLVVMARAVQLEVSQGAAFRDRATKPLSRATRLPGVRGRILARDGTLLACDRQIQALAVRYRRLQNPPDRQWLERTARQRLSRAERKDPQRMESERQRVAAENAQLATRLARLCGLSMSQWQQRARRIENRVARIARSHSRRRGFEEPVAEQFDYHVMAPDLPLEVVAEIKGNPQLYPATKIISHSRRTYPAGSLAAHLLGHLGRLSKEELADRELGDRELGDKELGDTDVEYGANDLTGRMGLERQYEALLRGRPGTAVELTNHGGEVLSVYRTRQPGVGRDLVLTIHPALQRSAEELLDAALERRQMGLQNAEPAGGAIVVMDISNGALLAAASAPRFDPNLFVGGSAEELTEVLSGKAHPMLDRTSRMAIAPGSVFKTLTAVALLETTAIDPAKQFFCQGYLHHPDQQRCAIYRRHGTGHGDVGLSDALAQSCNVYFFHHAARLGPGPLIDWALKFGFARPTGVDLPGESAGMVPVPVMMRELEGHRWGVGDTQSLSIGQGSLTTTPLQIARMMAALANGGRLVTPHLVSRLGLTEASHVVDDPIRVALPQAIDGLHPKTLETIRRGLVRVVNDPAGTAHGALWMDDISVAGKTGTAETGTDKTGVSRADHAWFAGFVPADKPLAAIVVALEHCGSGSTAAAPVAKRLVIRMRELGLF